jgi:hypothetical protein
MKVYLTGVNTVKSPKKNSNDYSLSPKKAKNEDIKYENEDVKEESLSLESDKKLNP